jgi:hypothetical protein
MKLPFFHSVETKLLGPDHLYLAIQTRRTHDAPDTDGVAIDDSLYRHIHVDLQTGELIENYVGPISL